jgi:hypothetical protein
VLAYDFLNEHLVEFAFETLVEHWDSTLQVGAVVPRLPERSYQHGSSCGAERALVVDAIWCNASDLCAAPSEVVPLRDGLVPTVLCSGEVDGVDLS